MKSPYDRSRIERETRKEADGRLYAVVRTCRVYRSIPESSLPLENASVRDCNFYERARKMRINSKNEIFRKL